MGRERGRGLGIGRQSVSRWGVGEACFFPSPSEGLYRPVWGVGVWVAKGFTWPSRS